MSDIRASLHGGGYHPIQQEKLLLQEREGGALVGLRSLKITMTLYARQKKRHRYKEQTFGLCE